MKQEDRTYRMPTLPSPNQDQVVVNKELIDAIKNIWIQLRGLRTGDEDTGTNCLTEADVIRIIEDNRARVNMQTSMWALISDTVKRIIRADASTHAIETIDYAHHEIHSGSSFTVCDTVACDTTTVKWMIQTPNTTKYAHLVFGLSCTGEATFKVTGDADRTAGTGLTVQNRRRVGTPAVATVTVSRTPTGGTTDGAAILFSKRLGITGAGSKSIEGSSTREMNEWILKPNTKYVVAITTYAASYVTMQLDWYEHTDKN